VSRAHTRARAGLAAAAIALAAVLAVAAIAGFTNAQTERIWLFLVPFACSAAAPLLENRRTGAADGPGAARRGALCKRLVTARAALM
jgi:hypothetical protein